MSTLSTSITYNVEDLNNSIRQTNVLLRAANALRLTYRDMTQTMRDPSFTNIMWTLIQLSRTYNALRRLLKLINAETNKAAAIIGGIIEPPIPPPPPTPTMFHIRPLSINVQAFLDNRPVGLDRLDLTNLPNDSETMIQAIMEEEAQLTVEEARQLLRSQVKVWTGNLADSISWMSEVDGIRINADAYYAWWVEFGHDNFGGYHYMTDATARTKLRLSIKLREQLNGLITDGL